MLMLAARFNATIIQLTALFLPAALPPNAGTPNHSFVEQQGADAQTGRMHDIHNVLVEGLRYNCTRPLDPALI